MSGPVKHKITVALAGNPNVGKSTLFNALTGMRQHTGNWPGKTVGIATGIRVVGDAEYHFVDLPGTYSLDGSSEDERIASGYIASNNADCTVVVCDAGCLERSLILAIQILAVARKAVICVNLVDEARRMGIYVDENALSEMLDVPVVLTSAGKKQGLHKLLAAIRYASEQEGTVHLSADAVRLAQEAAKVCVRTVQTNHSRFQQKADQLLLGRHLGIPVMMLLLLGIIWVSIWGANYPSAFLERLFDQGYEILFRWLENLPTWLRGILLDGMYITSARVISVMLPPMAIFFPLFTILEDLGYLPRMAFLLDGKMCRCGGCGKQALTLCMGLGCNAVGVTGCRIIDSPRERLMAILTNSMVPCNGRFPGLILLGSLFFGGMGGAFAVSFCVVLGILGVMSTTGILSRTVLRNHESTFLMEIPPLRKPQFGQILIRSLVDRTFTIALRALKVAAPAGALLWLLSNSGILRALAEKLDPVGVQLGMSGAILTAFIFSFPANELLIPVLLMILSNAQSLHGISGGSAMLIGAGITWKNAICIMVFSVFHWPCATTLLTVYKETGSMKKTAAAFFLPTAVGILLCLMLNLLLGEFCG